MKKLYESLLDDDDELFDRTNLDAGFPEKDDTFKSRAYGVSKSYWWKSIRISTLMEKYYGKSCGIIISWSPLKRKNGRTEVFLRVIFSPEKDGTMGWIHNNIFGKTSNMLEGKKLAYKVLLKFKSKPELLDKFINPEEYLSADEILDM